MGGKTIVAGDPTSVHFFTLLSAGVATAATLPLAMVAAERAQPSTFACGRCGAALVFDGLRAQTCPYCASPNIVERAAETHTDPRFVVTFVGDNAVARRALDRWLGSRTIFADSALARAKVEDLRGVYVPAYLYSAVGSTEYTAQIG